MPSPLVRTKKDEELWERAKEIVASEYPKVKEGSPRYYKLVTAIYLRMKYGLGGASREKVREALAEIKEKQGKLRKADDIDTGLVKQDEGEYARLAGFIENVEESSGYPLIVLAAMSIVGRHGNDLLTPSSDAYDGAVDVVADALGAIQDAFVRALAAHIVGALEANGWLRPVT